MKRISHQRFSGYNGFVQERWLRLHLAFAPYGSLLVTWLITLGVGAWQWNNRDNLAMAGQMIPLGATCYAGLIVLIERAARMFWALAQREKDRARWREEALKEGREEGLEKGREKGLEEGREEGLEEGRENERTRIVRELAAQGIALPPEALDIIRSTHNGNGVGQGNA